MAGLWIAWVKGLTRRREVVIMASALNLDRRTVAAMWMELWEWLDEEGGEWDADGGLLVRGVTTKFIDALLETPLFSRDACATGWMVEKPDGLYFPRFDRWNGSLAKERLNNSKRQRKHRDIRNADSVTTEEKRREYIKHTPDPFQGKPPTPKGPMVCTYCQVKQGEVAWAFDLDHFVPSMAGGSDHPSNLLPCCHVCNQIKQKRLFRTIEEARTHIHWKLWTSNRKRYDEPRKKCFGGKRPTGTPPPTISASAIAAAIPFSQRPENQHL